MTPEIDVLPPTRWLRSYRARWLGNDLVAGVTLAAYAIPVSLAYASLAGLPPVVGIYGYLLGGIGYALFGSSRQLAVGPTSAISLMVGSAVAGMAAGDPARHAQIAMLAGLVVASLSISAWALRLDSLTSFISETNLLGFKAGAALSIASTQLPALFGVTGGGDHFFTRLASVVRELPHLDAVTTAVGVTAIVLLVVGGALLPGRPVALGVVVLALLATSLTPLADAGLAVVGSVPSGLPHLVLPAIRLRDVDGILPLALGCMLLAYIEGVSAARTFADKHGYRLDARQELLGLGAANLAVALGGGYPVAGGLSQSAVNESAGARTPLALLFASLALGLCLLFLTGLVQGLPRAVLAAIVLVAVSGLIDVRGIARLWRVSRVELSVALLAFAGVLLFGILKGVLLAALASILMLLRRAAAPHVAFLVRLPGSGRFADARRHPEGEPIPGGIALRVESSLLYFNVDGVMRAVLDRVREEPDVRFVAWDLSSSPHVDLAGARMLAKLGDELGARGVTLHLAEASTAVRRLLVADGLGPRTGAVDRHASLAEVVEGASSARPGLGPPAPRPDVEPSTDRRALGTLCLFAPKGRRAACGARRIRASCTHRTARGQGVESMSRARWTGAAVAAMALLVACSEPAPPPAPPPEVLVAPVVERDVPIYSEWVGTLEGYVNAEIRPKVQGYLLTQNYQNGSVVKEGQLLFQIDPRQFQAALNQAIGSLESAKAILKKTELDVARYKPLAAEGAVSQEELDNAVQQNEANKAAVFQAQANVEQAKLNLDWTKVNSPIAGIAGINQAQIGDLVGSTTILTTVSTVDPIKVQFPISEREYLRFAAKINRESATGKPSPDSPKLELMLANGAVYPHEGHFYAVNRQVDERTGTLLVQAVFPNSENILRPGGYGKARAATTVVENALVIPQRAVSDLQGTYQVYVVVDGKASVRTVTPGPRAHSDWVISKGLEPGEQVIVEGLQKVRDGVPVSAKPAPPADAPGIEPSAIPPPAPTAGAAAS